MVEKPSTTVRIFNRTEYYSVHGPDALLAAKDIFMTTAVVKSIGTGDNKLESLALSIVNYEFFIRHLLLVKHYRVEVYSGGGKTSNDWVLELKGSPGNLTDFEDILAKYEVTVEGSIIGLKLGDDGKNKVVGIACIDAGQRKITVSEFVDNDVFSTLESVLVQLAPRECIVPSGGTKDAGTDYAAIIKDLTRLLHFQEDSKEDAATLPQINLLFAMASLKAVIKYLELMSDESNMGQFSISTFDSSQYVHLDFAAVRALQLYPITTSIQPSSALGSSSDNLYGLFARWIRTPAGHRLLRCWLSQPLKDLNRISERHDIIEVGMNSISVENESDSKSFHSMFGEPLKDLLLPLKKFEEMVETTIDLEKAEQGEILVKAEFDEGLQELKNKMDELSDEMKGLLAKAGRDLGLDKGLKLESNSQYGYFFRITLKDEKLLRNNRGYIILDSNKAGVRFQSSSLQRANDEYLAARAEYGESQKAIENEIINIAVGYVDSLQSLGELIAALDVLVAFACTAAAAPTQYIRPEMLPLGGSSSGRISLTQARHPCLETLDSVSFIPNDVLFEKDKSMFHIITGPNMGGKSTFLRTVGLTVLMAQIGSFVPCSNAKISIVDAIMCRVGAGDCQARGISTFMAEMLETSAILRMATSNSLILIDELGRGTSTFDGYGLAWAISEHIAKNIKCYTLFATHFHELTSLAELVPAVVNEHVTAEVTDDVDGQEGSLTLLYTVKPGICDQSFGVHVAKIAGIPNYVLEFAKMKQAELEDLDILGADKIKDPVQAKYKKEGELLMEKTVKEMKELCSRGLSDEEFQEEVNKLKESVTSKNNPYIEEILKTIVA
ncbi:hypothetical protein J437_LFUL000900 [Ladona fulva]|uniref:DNA mismatch repair proteins mutS family domain-containing protein n=1 Tax=Ladona fulva TaxID=123851 RepID=A0A8K0K8B2_LADFU|nr:hypothetical protein J437_LFUL000900 [Ladona fulva]